MSLSGVEILVILLVALIVLGPQRLPEAARQVGKAMGELRRISTGFQNEMRSAMDDAAVDRSTTRTASQNVLDKELPPADGRGDTTEQAIRSVSGQGTPNGRASGNGQRRGRPRRTEPLRAAPDPADGATGSDRNGS